MSLQATLQQVALLLAECEVDYFIGGSLASALWGQERTTLDADIAAFFTHEKLERLIESVQWPLIIDSNDIRDSLKSDAAFRSGQILNSETLDKIDLFLLGTDDYASCQMSRRRWVEISNGVSLPFASPEDIVITKLRWYVLGNRMSDRQWNDIVQVLEMQQGNLDQGYLNQWCLQFGLEDLLAEAQSQAVSDDV